MRWRPPSAGPHPADLSERGAAQPPALSRGRNLRLAESQFSKCCGVPSPTRGEGVRGGGVRKSAAVNTNDRAFLFRVSTNPRVALPNGGCGFATPTRPREKPRPMRLALTRQVSPWRTHARQNRPVALTHQCPSGIFIISSICCGLQNIPNQQNNTFGEISYRS